MMPPVDWRARESPEELARLARLAREMREDTADRRPIHYEPARRREAPARDDPSHEDHRHEDRLHDAEPLTEVDAAESAPMRRPLAILTAREIIEQPAPDEIIEGVLWAGCISVLVAESGAGKSFAALSQAAALSAGTPWHGRQTLRGAAVHLPYEADALGSRFRALRDVQGYDLDDVYVLRPDGPLSPILTRDGEQRSDAELRVGAALASIRDARAAAGQSPIRMLSIDTVSASSTGPENASEAAAAYLRAVRRLLAIVPEAGCELVHHAGWQDGDTARKRERGSSAWRGNVDATLMLEAGEYSPETGEATLTLKCLKSRDGERGAPLHLIRRRVELPGIADRYGRPVTSCIIVPDDRTGAFREAERAQAADAAHRAAAVDVLRVMHTHPDATSTRLLQPYVGRRLVDVQAAVAVILRDGWAIAGTRGQPYRLTPAGFAALEVPEIDTAPNGSERLPESLGTVKGERLPAPPLRGAGAGAVHPRREIDERLPSQIESYKATGADGEPFRFDPDGAFGSSQGGR